MVISSGPGLSQLSMPAAAPAPAFDWRSLMSVVELAGNTALTLLVPGGAALTPLLTALESAVNPLLQSIGTPQSSSAEIMTVYATIIGVLTTLKQTPGMPAATLAKIDEYLVAAQNGTASYLQAGNGFDPGSYLPVPEIV